MSDEGFRIVKLFVREEQVPFEIGRYLDGT